MYVYSDYGIASDWAGLWSFVNDLFVLFANRKEICKFKASNKNVNFPAQICIEIMSEKFGAAESREVSYKWKMCIVFSRLQCYE